MIANFLHCNMRRPPVAVLTSHSKRILGLISESLMDSWHDLPSLAFTPMNDDEIVAVWADVRPNGLTKITRREQDVQKEIEEARRELFGAKIVDDVINDPASWDFALQA